MKKMFLGVLFTFAGLVQANENTLHIMSAWAPATFKLAVNGAAYVSAHNMSGESVEIVGLSVSDTVSARVELHETFVENDMARMRQLKLPMAIDNGDMLSMQRGGKHLMLLGLKGPLQVGQTFELQIQFANGTSQSVTVEVSEDSQPVDHSHHH